MLCKICVCMLRGGTGQQWNGTHDLTFKHHSRTESLRRSREAGCSICIALVNELRHEVDLLDDRPLSIAANLSVLSLRKDRKAEAKGAKTNGGMYRLDFVLEKRCTRTFVLRETDPDLVCLRTPKSYDTSSAEVFELALSWIKKCKCAPIWNTPGRKWYPRRLIDLNQLRKANGIRELESLTFYSENANFERTKVMLVETSRLTQPSDGNNRYVTLSHCWGKPKSVQSQLKLTAQSQDRFMREGIELRELSKTFRDAMLFACLLEKVGYIWIDSLCIVQQSSDPGANSTASEIDWREQSRVMDQVYRNSFLNISATAAVDSDQGLFFPRHPEYLWEDEINLNVTGLLKSVPANSPTQSVNPTASTRSAPRTAPLPSPTRGTSRNRTPLQRLSSSASFHVAPKASSKLEDGLGKTLNSSRERAKGTDILQRCTVIDVSFWDDLVDQAPVNRRGWVLQERVMAPRILHFCRDQIAWECAEFQHAEGHPEGHPTFKRKLGDIVDEGRFKSLLEEDGERLRQNRLKGYPDPDKGLKNLYYYELWKRMVEVYSRTKLTVSRDKLIAFSGIAKRFSELLGCGDDAYIAGMWKEHLESQLLWYVNEKFKDGIFENGARRDSTRAPSFSWAAIDAPHGIIYGESTNYGNANSEDLLYSVDRKSISISWLDPENKFGLIDKGIGNIWIRAKYLQRIQLRKLGPPQRVPYSWRLLPDDHENLSETVSNEEHFNVYLDAPEMDVDIFNDNARIYCMPAAFGERTVKKNSRYLICLILQFVRQRGQYEEVRRIGLTKLSKYADMGEEGRKALFGNMVDKRICIS